MERKPIAPADIVTHPIALWEPGWLLLSSGDFASRKYNSMTVSWGALGVMWGRPMATVVVRPQRHTRKFLDEGSTFTLCAFVRDKRKVLELFGTKSGLQIDKIQPAGLTPQAATTVNSPVYDEAILAIECRKVYFDDLKPGNFLADFIAPTYQGDYHRIYMGEIIAVTGTDAYRAG